MKGSTFETSITWWALVVNTVIATVSILRSTSKLRWFTIYIINALSNLLIDRMLVSFSVLEYPVRLLPNLFRSNILFDLFTYPTLDLLYNQLTYKSKPVPAMLKFLYFVIPLVAAERWVVRHTRLIKWGKGWGVFQSFITIVIKSMITRCIIHLTWKKLSK